MASPKAKKTKTIQRPGSSSRRAYGALGGAKPRMFRASHDVGQLVDDEVAKTNRTQSTVIDERLRRSYWIEDRFSETLIRNFGGRGAMALGFIVARAAVAVEHTMHARATDSAEVASQVSKAVAAIVDLVCRPASGHSDCGPTMLLELKTAKLESDVPKPAAVLESQIEMYAGDLGGVGEPWRRVVLAIDRNLAEEHRELWWPLADMPEPTRSQVVPLVPLRPSIDDLRAVWQVRDEV